MAISGKGNEEMCNGVCPDSGDGGLGIQSDLIIGYSQAIKTVGFGCLVDLDVISGRVCLGGKWLLSGFYGITTINMGSIGGYGLVIRLCG